MINYYEGQVIAVKKSFKNLLGFPFDWYVIFHIEIDDTITLWVLDGLSDTGYSFLNIGMIDKRKKWLAIK